LQRDGPTAHASHRHGCGGVRRRMIDTGTSGLFASVRTVIMTRSAQASDPRCRLASWLLCRPNRARQNRCCHATLTGCCSRKLVVRGVLGRFGAWAFAVCALQYISPNEHAEPQNRNVSICFGSPIGQRHMLGRSSINLTRTGAARGPDLLRRSRFVTS
jgi:hypothetical protein